MDESNTSGLNQIATINKALDRIHFTWEQILFNCADNTSVNPYIARQVGKEQLGCKSHVLALAVKQFLSPYQKGNPDDADLILDRVNEVMKKLKQVLLK